MITAKVKTDELIQALKLLGNNTLPNVMGYTLNQVANAVENNARKNAKKSLTIRRGYSINAIRQDRHARGTDASRMFVRVAIIRAPYMIAQEFGNNDDGNPKYENKVAVPSALARGGNKLNEILKQFSLRSIRLGKDPSNIGEKYPGFKFKRFFLGKPKGKKDRPYGIYFRHNANHRLMLIRTMRDNVKNVSKVFFGKAVERFATDQALVARFSKNAQEAIKKWARIT
jgi:hypothetical protein